MLSRFQIKRGVNYPRVPGALFKDTRKHVKAHVLAPTKDMVTRYLSQPTLDTWQWFQREYLLELQKRADERPEEFEELRRLAQTGDYYLGCSCPTPRNPLPCRCHTIVALEFMKERYPDLNVEFTQYPYLETK